MMEHFAVLLDGMAARPDEPFAAIPLLAPAERALLDAWNDTAYDFPRGRLIHEMIAEQARQTPDAPAVAFDGGSLSYAELDARANRLARHLRGLGVGAEARVGISLERGPEVAVAILGVLKAGGAYVPLDPGYPAERLAYMLEDSAARVLLTADALVERLPATAARVVRLEADAAAIQAESAEPVESGATAENLAYVIYTSGSTGRPKGVAVAHGAVVNYAVDMAARMGLGADDRVLQFASLSFDVVVEELFPAWFSGGAVVFTAAELYSPPELLRAVDAHGVTWMELPTAYWHEWVHELAQGGGEIPASLRFVIVGGERISPERMAEWARLDLPLVHVFGSTETACTSTTLRLEAGDDGSRWPNLPVGTAHGNVRLYVLDRGFQPVPPGIPGELFIGGEGLARGYLGRPALTAEKFVPDPHSAEPGARLYRTGDRVRWLADGNLEFLARIDHQVKIRGFRIETGEVEAALTAISGIRDAFVMAREDVPGDRRLVAYLVADDGADASHAALRSALEARLPEYMVPSAFVPLDALPLSPNGKVDRRALPAPEYAEDEDADERHRHPVREVLAGIWAEVLRRVRVGVRDNFFELGGHSLLATRVVSRVRAALSVELPLRALFESPTVAGLAERIDALRRAGHPVLPPVVPVDRTGALPLSSAQERLWFLNRMEPDSPVFNVPAALRLTGALDAPALERALGEIVRRHEALRTTFAEVEGVPAQVIAPFAGFVLPVEDWSGMDADEREARLRRRTAEDAVAPFDLAAGPLFRTTLLRLDGEEHVLLLSTHHIVSDAWSMGVLFRELSALYGAYMRGAESPLAALPVQYADYAVWEREQLRGEALDRQLAYWKDRLAGAPAVLALPADHPRPAVKTYRGAHVRFEVSRERLDQLRAVGRGEGATLYMVLLASFQVLLARYSGSDDIVVGSPVAGRTRREVEELIGFFINPLVLRTDLSGDPTFHEVLRRVRGVTLGAYEHQDVPFEKLVAELQPERSLSHSPIFQVSFALDDEENGGGGLPGVQVRGVSAATDTAKLDLGLDVTIKSTGLVGALLYSTDLFAHGTVERMAAHLLRVFEQIADAAEVRLSGLELLGEGERAQVLGAWNRTDDGRSVDGAIHELFAAQAARTPEAEALRFGGRATTYRALDEAANRLAHHLVERGVGPEVRVGIFAERAPETVVAILAVLKAGGAYVPLDSAYPADRLRYMLEDCGARLVIAPAGIPSSVPAGLVADLLDPRAEAAAIAARPADAPCVAVDVESVAYVIYTSGSTGRPKGVMVAHRGVPNLARAQAARFGIEPGGRVLQFASFSFDASVSELFTALLTGATLVMGVRDELLPGPGLLDTLRRERVTVATLPASVLAALAPDALPDLRTVVSAGEAVDAAVVERWGARRTFVNAYGPTEGTVCATSAECRADGRAPSIGAPLPNVRVYVLDGRMGPMPVGLPGELFVGGAGLARGYLGRPALTAERFVPDPFGAEPGARLYRTGDRARWKADGTLEFMGRLDEQVKVRGYRIEPGEVESALRAHPGVREARVVVREDEPGDRRLVAYLVGRAEVDGLREHLQRTLPEYMVPAAFVVAGRDPADAQRQAGPQGPSRAGVRRGAGRATWRRAPRWKRRWPGSGRTCWGWTRWACTDNFFELGGDSILVIQVVTRARRAGLQIAPPQLFEHQTVAELAAVVAPAPAEPARAPAAEKSAATAVPPTPIQAWFFAQEHPSPAHYNQSVLLEVDGSVDDGVVEAALKAVVAHHAALRLRFRRTDAGWAQSHAAESGITLERVDLSALPAGERDAAQREAADRAQSSLDIERGPLGRAVLFHRGDEGRRLLIVLHHLVVDTVSWCILPDDLERACGQLSGASADLGAPSTPFHAWAGALQAYASTDAPRDEAAHWLAQGAEGVAPLPVDGDGGSTGSGTVTVRLEAEETRALLQDVPAAYRTQINDVLLCALADAVSGWSGGTRVRLALEGHGREETVAEGVDLTRTVGWFTTLYPVVLELGAARAPGDRLRRVKEQLRAVPRRGIGYGVLRYLSADAELRGALAAEPEPEISFNYLGQLNAGAEPSAMLRAVRGPRGREWADDTRGAHPLAINGGVTGGCLEMWWSYGEATHRRETVERLAARYVEALRTLIAHCREEGAGGYTPSDFPLAQVTQAELDAAIAGRTGIEDLYPLSPMQEGMLFHALYAGTQEYHTQDAQRLEGALDADLFRRAWAEAVRRHAVLRTSFAWEGLRRPLQRVHAAVEAPWRIEDWRGLPEAQQEAALQRYMEEDRATGFVLEQAPVLRFALFRVGEQAHWFVWSQHHVLMDGWSCSRVADEVFRLYHGWTSGKPVELARTRPYRDYVAWLERQDRDQAERFWRGVLAGFTAPTRLGVDRAAPAGAELRRDRRAVVLDAEVTARLEHSARRMQVTLNTLLQGAWALLLSRYGGEDEVVFGSTGSGRAMELEGAQEMVGLFINTIPLRVPVPAEARLGAWLAGLQRAYAEARAYEHTPLVEVQGWSDVPRGTPLFESLFVFENYPMEEGGGGEADGRLRVTRTLGVEWTSIPSASPPAPAGGCTWT